MKKVLLVAHYFPPHTYVGAQRPYRLAKYFPKYGWEPIVLTVKRSDIPPEGIKLVETPHKDIKGVLKSKFGLNPDKGTHHQLGLTLSKNDNFTNWKSKIIKLVNEVVCYPDSEKGWYQFAIKFASKFLLKERVDAIISTSSPVTSHLIARKLKQKHKIPWIADLRDPWMQNPYHNKYPIIKYFERRLELRTLSDADVIVTVTDPWIRLFQKLHMKKRIVCVTNGFDKDDFPKIPTKLTRKFTLTYTGSLYNGKRDPTLLFEVIEQLIIEKRINKDLIEIRLFSQKEAWLMEEVNKYNLSGVVNYYGQIPREEALKKQRESQLLLLLLWDNKNEEGFCPAKVYEYLGAGRPIIAIGGKEHVTRDLLEKTNAGKYTWNADTLKNVLLNYYMEFVESGEVKCHGNNCIENFEYRSIAKKYSEILNGLVVK